NETVKNKAQNPIIFADVPDMSIIRVDDMYYMASTTMHLSPGLPIMKSDDLVNWELVSYAYDILADVGELRLEDDNNTYGRGSWAPGLRYHNGVYYASTFSATTNKTHIYTTRDIENEPWKETSFSPSLHDHTLFFDDNGKVYLIWGVGEITMVELESDLSGIKEGTERVLIENASAPAGDNILLPAEGSQLFKIDGMYYLFNITWVREGMRKVLIHRAESIYGPYEGRLVLRDRGIAQGGIIDTPEGNWFAYLFRDYGSVGRIPYLAPVTWEDGWPVLGIDGKVPDELDLPADKGLSPGIVASDDFKREPGEPDLPLVWQWNHNPDHSGWMINGQEGYLRLTNTRVDDRLLQTRNTLSQRTIGPVSSGSIGVDVSGMKDGDYAGLALLQYRHGKVGVKREDGNTYLVMVLAEGEERTEQERVLLEQDVIYFKAECDFRDRTDTANFYYSLDGENWVSIGSRLDMVYTLPHFMGYRFGLFNYATEEAGGYVDFQFFTIEEHISGR
ncbi:glycoside hydrolase 43 family protein, partial [Balneolaceae bacterium ANBcel3]|nr:glycoside hydrolase 43 family protein [Balneolaceae bacterium ANBcel3]